jgi:hypothetical protein
MAMTSDRNRRQARVSRERGGFGTGHPGDRDGGWRTAVQAESARQLVKRSVRLDEHPDDERALAALAAIEDREKRRGVR